jgi:hypothetical protein
MHLFPSFTSFMRTSPKNSLLLQTHHTEIVDAADVDVVSSPHAIDHRDPNYDPFDDEYADDVAFYLREETENLGTVPYHVVRSTRTQSTPAKRSGNRFGMGATPHKEVPEKSLSEFRSALEGILEELFDSNEFTTCVSRISGLDCRLYHDELIAHAIRFSLDRDDKDRANIAELITLMGKSGKLSIGQISRAFEKLFLNWEDICLDVPDAPSMILKFVEVGIADGIIPAGFIAKLPEQFLSTVAAIEPCVEEFPEVVQQLVALKEFKKHVTLIMGEFIRLSGKQSISDIAAELRRIAMPNLHHEFIRRAINKSLDMNDRERELVCQLLSGLRDTRTLTEDDFLWGFSHLLGGLEDLTLDCPNAVNLVSKFLVRAVTDELIPPSFLENAIRLSLGGEEKGVLAATLAKNFIDDAQVEWAELRNVWEIEEIGSEFNGWKAELDIALNEYHDSHDKAEFCRQMHEWALSTSRVIVLVKAALLKAMDGTGADCLAVVDLLEYAVNTAEELRSSDIARALAELDTAQDDLKLDIPDFVQMLNTFGGLLRARDLIPLVSSPRASNHH